MMEELRLEIHEHHQSEVPERPSWFRPALFGWVVAFALYIVCNSSCATAAPEARHMVNPDPMGTWQQYCEDDNPGKEIPCAIFFGDLKQGDFEGAVAVFNEQDLGKGNQESFGGWRPPRHL